MGGALGDVVLHIVSSGAAQHGDAAFAVDATRGSLSVSINADAARVIKYLQVRSRSAS